MTMLLQKTLLTALLTITLIGSGALVGCDKLPHNNKTQDAKAAQVNIPKTAPLIAGESVSSALSRAVPVQNQTSTSTLPSETKTNNQGNQTITKPSIESRNATTPQSASTQSIVTNKTQPGTPEFVLKQALDTIYFGEAKQAGQYFLNNNAKLQNALQQTQPEFQKAIESISFGKTSYNANKTEAKIDSTLKYKGVAAPQPRIYDMVKTNGQWKIIAQ